MRASLVATAILSVSLPLAAQQPAAAGATPATHTVQRGETLWSLAKQYLGDAYLWPEIYRLNTGVIEDPHWIYPGEVLRIPGAAAAAPASDVAAGPQKPYDPGAPSVFRPRKTSGTRGERQAANFLKSRQAVRPGEYLAAPFVGPVGGPYGAGKVIRTATSQIVTPSLERRDLQSEEPVFLRLPLGAKRENGERFLTYTLGPVLPDRGQVVIVTGVVELREDPGAGDARAVIIQRFRPVEDGQGLTAIDSLIPRLDVHPSSVAFGAEGSLLWVQDNPVIPGIGSYLVLSYTSRDGVVPGDQVTLFAPLGKSEAGAPVAPEEGAVVQILRVTSFGSSAVLLARTQADVQVGAAGRLTAKMP
ncbi:MAG: LysM peptidoglycan-binding domain-containing protein [Gemmatimonadaceae bacterium]|nr:LysM peptidoglycan-binding domain-containing protein [Gemmatimonadaceae bacterium]